MRDETSADNIAKGRDLENYNVPKINTLHAEGGCAVCFFPFFLFFFFGVKTTDELSGRSIQRRGLRPALLMTRNRVQFARPRVKIAGRIFRTETRTRAGKTGRTDAALISLEVAVERFNHRRDPVDEALYFRPIGRTRVIKIQGEAHSHIVNAEVSNYDERLVKHLRRCIRIARRCRACRSVVTPHVELRVTPSNASHKRGE